jgi:hypothetical protein
MSKTGVISASLRTEPHSAQAANSQPKPNDAFVELHDFAINPEQERMMAKRALATTVEINASDHAAEADGR